MGIETRQPAELQRNLLLRAVLAVGEPLSPLDRVTLAAGQALFTRPEHGRNVYFPLDSVISMVVCFSDGGWSEVLSVGREGAIGPFNPAFMFPGHEILVTLGGEALIADFGDLEQRALDRPELLRLLRGYVGFCAGAMAQRSACHRLHRLDERLATWLWLAYRRSGAELRVNPAWIAGILGAQEASIGILLDTLLTSEVLAQRPAAYMVADAKALRQAACECLPKLSRFLDD